MKTISDGGFVPGDLGYLCAVGAALAAAGAITGDVPAAGVGLIIVAAEC